MSTKDVVTKKFLSNPRNFADVVNLVLFKSKPVVTSDNVHEMDSSQIEIIYNSYTDGTDADSTKLANKLYAQSKYRDILKSVIINDVELCVNLIIGIESQTHIHYAMPVRNMLYDSINYSNQVSKFAHFNKAQKNLSSSHEFLSGLKKDDKIKPVITIVVYFGSDKWDGACSIHDMIDWSNIPKDLIDVVPNYNILLLEPSTFENLIPTYENAGTASSTSSGESPVTTDSEICKVLGAIKNSTNEHDFNNFLDSHPLFSREAANVVNQMCELNVPQPDIEKGDVINMCQAIKEIRESGIREGRIAGMREGRRDGIVGIIDTALSFGADLDTAIDTAANNMGEDRESVVIIWNEYVANKQ